MVARGRQAVVCGLGELADLHVVLEQDSVRLCFVIAYLANDLHEVTKGVLRMSWPSVKTDYDTLIPQFFHLVSSDVESTVFVVSRHKLVNFEILDLLSLLPHGAFLRGVHQLAGVDAATVVSLLLLVNCHYFATRQ